MSNQDNKGPVQIMLLQLRSCSGTVWSHFAPELYVNMPHMKGRPSWFLLGLVIGTGMGCNHGILPTQRVIVYITMESIAAKQFPCCKVNATWAKEFNFNCSIFSW